MTRNLCIASFVLGLLAVGWVGVGYLGGHALGDLVAAQTRATAETLARRGRPVRTMSVERQDERAMGALFMHFMLETILAARLMERYPACLGQLSDDHRCGACSAAG